ncbi:MAG: hypothetical protein GY749_24025 [Desulfobacteraceae bacterium]|nr:hypothetical protein [Desulfobacteraceae bacterium]
MKKKSNITIIRPELSLESYLSARQKRSKLTITDADDAIVLLNEIKELASNHSVLIYLDSKDVVVEIETFMNDIGEFDAIDTNRALAGAIYRQNKYPMVKVILARTMPDTDILTTDHIDMKRLANLAIKLVWIRIELVDVILIGSKGYFSLRKNKKGWAAYNKELNIRKDLSVEEPLFPDIVKEPRPYYEQKKRIFIHEGN